MVSLKFIVKYKTHSNTHQTIFFNTIPHNVYRLTI